MKRSWFLGLLILATLPLLAEDLPSLPQATVSPVPGVYSAPLRLAVQSPVDATVRYRFLESQGTSSFPWTGDMVLDCLPGEVRVYRLRLTTDLASGETVVRDFRYQVSRPATPVPTVQPEPGRYTAAVSVMPDLPAGWKVRENDTIPSFPRTLDVAPGRSESFIFDVVGPDGERLSWSYAIDRRDQEADGLEVVSPIEGDWANPQLLVATFRGVDRVLWSYGDRFDPNAARDYEGPVLLDRSGQQSVVVAARSRFDGRWIERSVRWTNGSAALSAEGWPVSGVKTSGLTLPAVANTSVSWDEGRNWQPSSALVEPASTTSRKILAVQIRQEGRLFRSVYWLDARAPEAPTAEFMGGWNPRVSFSGPTEALYRVSWTKADGQSIEEPGALWGPLGSWKVPDGIVAARIRVIGTNGLEGRVATTGFPETGWSTPTWEPWDQKGPQIDRSALPLGGRVLPRPGFWPVYEVSDQPSVVEPGARSPLLTGAFLPAFPWGSDRTLYVRFAWRDAGGLTGPASPVYAVRVDRVPPQSPEVLSVTGQVLVKIAEGEEEGGNLFWATSSDRVTTAEALTFQPYNGPLDVAGLRPTATTKVWLHAQAQDRAGNTGTPRLNVALAPSDQESRVVHVDTDPLVGETPVESGGVYPWPAFRLRSLDQGRDLWVGVTEQSSLPEDWKTRVQPWTGLLSRSIGQGERRTFLVFWNAKTTSGWTWTQPKTLSLTLDLSAPGTPSLAETWPSSPLGSAWTLGLKPARSGDTLRYTFTLDGSTPPDPLVFGEPWPGTRTWDAPPSGRVLVRVRVAALSASGLGMEIPLGAAVTVDRAPPPVVAPALEPFTYRSGAFTVPVPEGATVVRYTLTSDGKLPGVPIESSPILPSRGLVLEGKEGQSVFYRFRWRPYSAAGVPGQVTDAFGVVIDRTSSSQPLVYRGSATRLPVPQLRGVPSTGISATPVTLVVDGSSEFLRYEVREGVGTPRPVTAGSSPWQGPLVLDGGSGVDRSYAVSLRAFSPEGVPLSEEASYFVRVDRAIPAAPQVSLVSDLRGPAVTLQALEETNPEETLFYRWAWESFPTGKGEGEWTALGNAPPVFAAPGGNLTRLKLWTYLRDEAGNQGVTVEQSVLIDQNVVYVAPSGTGEGTRSRPLGSLEAALDKARKEGRRILMVASGAYAVRNTLDLDGLTVYGGLTTSAWETTPDPGRSLWSTASGFTGKAFLESGSLGWSLANVDLTVSGPSLDQVVLVQGAEVSIRNGTWTWSGALRGWEQEGGRVEWTNVAITYTARPQGTLVDWTSVGSSVRGLRVSAALNQGGLLVSLKECDSLFQDVGIVSKKAVGYDGIWSASGSKLHVDQLRIQAGDGAERATAFLLRNTQAALWNTEVVMYGSAANTGYQISGGSLEVQKGTLSLLKGKEFNQGLVLDGVDTRLRAVELKIESGAYQGGFSVDGGSLDYTSGTVRLAGGGLQAWGGQFLSTVLVNVTDVSWFLTNKTPGEVWKKIEPWAEGSSVQGSPTSGW